jgi:hypothetical protein
MSRKVDATPGHWTFARNEKYVPAISSAGPNRDLSGGTREQPFWDEHAAFIDQLVADGSILMGGPFS